MTKNSTNSRVKEQFLNEIKTKMVDFIDETQMDILIKTLSMELHDLELSKETYLPSVEVIDNYTLCNNYLASKRIEGASPNTLRAYKYSIRTMLNYLDCNIVDITTNHLRVLFARYGETVNLTTLDNMRRNLNAFFQWLENEEYISQNPCRKIKKVKYEHKIKTPLSTIEVEKIRDSCFQEESGRELAIVDLLLSTGVRCEEVTKIRIGDCDFENRTIKIHGKGAKQRIVYMTDRCRLHLLEHINNRKYESEYLFCNTTGSHNKLSTEGLSLIMRRIGKRAGVERCQVHRFRKYFATTLFIRGCDIIYVQQLLGHAKLDTTKKHYLDVSQSYIRNEFDKFAA